MSIHLIRCLALWITFQLFNCSWNNVVAILHFLQAWWHLVNINKSVIHFVCRLFIASKVVSKVLSSEDAYVKVNWECHVWDYYASLPPSLRYNETFHFSLVLKIVQKPMSFHLIIFSEDMWWYFNSYIVCEPMFSRLIFFLNLMLPVAHNLPPKWLLNFQIIHESFLCSLGFSLRLTLFSPSKFNTLVFFQFLNLFWSHCCDISSFSSSMMAFDETFTTVSLVLFADNLLVQAKYPS